MKYPIWSMNPKTRAKQKEPYVVEAHDHGRAWTCTCPDFTIRKKGKVNCKHIDYVIAHNKEQERLQAEVQADFDKNGLGDWGDWSPKPDEDDPDVSVAPAS